MITVQHTVELHKRSVSFQLVAILGQALRNLVLQDPRAGLVYGPQVPARTFSDRQHDIILCGICQQPS